METLDDTLPPVPEGKQLAQLWVGLLMYSDMKYNLYLTGRSHDRMIDCTFVENNLGHTFDDAHVYNV